MQKRQGQGQEAHSHRESTVGLRVEHPIWLEHKCSGIYNFYPLPLVDRFVKLSKSAPWFIRIFKGAAFLKNDHLLQVSTHEQIMNDLSEC